MNKHNDASSLIAAEMHASGDAYVEIIRSLIRAVPQGEPALQALVASQMRALGCGTETIEHTPQALDPARAFFANGQRDQAVEMRTTVAGHLAGPAQGRSLLFFAHPDGEPVHNTSQWRHDPFAAEIENGRLYGWSVADDLQGVAAMIAGLSAVLGSGLRPQGNVYLISSASKRQALGIVAALESGIEADAAIYLHPAESGAGLDDVKAATSGMLKFEITIQGAPPPTSEPTHTPFLHQAVNPLDKAWIIYRALQELDRQRGINVVHPVMDKAIGRSTNLLLSTLQAGDREKVTKIAPRALLAGSLTFPPGEEMAAVMAQVEGAIVEAAEGDDWLAAHPPQLQWTMGTNGVEIPESSALFQTVSRAIVEVTGRRPSTQSLHSASDIRVPVLHKGIPTVGFGSLCGDLVQSGGRDEWIDIPDYLAMVQVVAEIITSWCGVEA